MQDISKQFYGRLNIAKWITAEYNEDKIKNLINRVGMTPPFPPELSMWVLGPRPDKKGLYLYAHIEASDRTAVFSEEVLSLNPSYNIKLLENKIYHLLSHVLVYTSDKRWYTLKLHKSAIAVAKRLDMLLHGSYTDVVLLDAYELFDTIEDLHEKEKQ